MRDLAIPVPGADSRSMRGSCACEGNGADDDSVPSVALQIAISQPSPVLLTQGVAAFHIVPVRRSAHRVASRSACMDDGAMRAIQNG